MTETAGQREPRERSVAIIGAGAAGLSAARHLLAAGHRVTIYEIGSKIGGLWVYDNDNQLSAAYRSLHINSEPAVTHYPGFPFPEGTSLFPSHWEVSAYLNSFADHFHLREVIRFRTRVTSVEPVAGGGQSRWRASREPDLLRPDGDVGIAHARAANPPRQQRHLHGPRRLPQDPLQAGGGERGGQTVTFTDASAVEVDTIMAATGYEMDLPFLPPELSPVVERRLDLYRRVIHPAWPGLYFAGFFNANGGGNISLMDVQTEWIAALLSGKVRLPDAAAMRAAIAAELVHHSASFPSAPRYGLELDPLRYRRQVAEDMARVARPDTVPQPVPSGGAQ